MCMDRLFTVVDSDGVVITAGLSRDDMFCLRGLRRSADSFDLVEVSAPLVKKTKTPYVWTAVVLSCDIRVAIKRLRALEETRAPNPSATGGWTRYQNPTQGGRTFHFYMGRSFSFPTTARCARERIIRQLLPQCAR